MALSNTSICDFGWKVRDFALKGVDGKTYTLADVRGPKGTLVFFICNHCPYVKASIGRIVAEAKHLRWGVRSSGRIDGKTQKPVPPTRFIKHFRP
jgi:AhpC/TSA family